MIISAQPELIITFKAMRIMQSSMKRTHRNIPIICSRQTTTET